LFDFLVIYKSVAPDIRHPHHNKRREGEGSPERFIEITLSHASIAQSPTNSRGTSMPAIFFGNMKTLKLRQKNGRLTFRFSFHY